MAKLSKIDALFGGARPEATLGLGEVEGDDEEVRATKGESPARPVPSDSARAAKIRKVLGLLKKRGPSAG